MAVSVSEASVLSNNFKSKAPNYLPAFVLIELMYREKSNDKTRQLYAFPNDGELTLAEIRDWYERYVPNTHIVASNHALPNLAPLSSVTEESDDEDAHCFMEITFIDVSDSAGTAEQDGTLFSLVYERTIETQTAVSGSSTPSDNELKVVNVDSDMALLIGRNIIATYDPACDSNDCYHMFNNVVSSLSRAYGRKAIEVHIDIASLPDGWRWKDVIDLLPSPSQNASQKSDSNVPVLLNIFDDDGIVVDSTTMMLAEHHVSDIIDHAAQFVLSVREQGASTHGSTTALDELAQALVVAGVISDVE